MFFFYALNTLLKEFLSSKVFIFILSTLVTQVKLPSDPFHITLMVPKNVNLGHLHMSKLWAAGLITWTNHSKAPHDAVRSGDQTQGQDLPSALHLCEFGLKLALITWLVSWLSACKRCQYPTSQGGRVLRSSGRIVCRYGTLEGPHIRSNAMERGTGARFVTKNARYAQEGASERLVSDIALVYGQL